MTLLGKAGWREVEIGLGSSPASCPVEALELRLKFARISRGPQITGQRKETGPMLLNDREVAKLVKRAAQATGLRGDLPEQDRPALFSGHFLRSGFASSAEADERHVQKQLGHASAE